MLSSSDTVALTALPPLTPAHPLTGAAALVTGGSSGIGQALALALAGAGIAVCLVGRNQVRLEATAAAARRLGVEAIAVPCELTDDAAVRTLPALLPPRWQTLHLLLHCAGTVAHGRLATHAISELDRQYQLNVRAPYLLTQVLLPHLAATALRPYTIVFINSMAAYICKAENGQYSATKAALKAVADSLREEVTPQGGRVLSVYPGKTATPLLRQLCAADGEQYHAEHYIQPADLAALVLDALRLPGTALLPDLQVRSVRHAPVPLAGASQ